MRLLHLAARWPELTGLPQNATGLWHGTARTAPP